MRIIGHGIDLVDIHRIETMLDAHGRRFIERCFTDAEQAYAEAGKAQRVQRYAARFAGKEAVLKAMGTGLTSGITWRDMSIDPTPGGRPIVHVVGRCAELAQRAGISQWHISLSHTATMAMASVIAAGNPEK